MNAYYKVRNFLIPIILVFITTGTTHAECKPTSHLLSETQVQKEPSLDEFTLFFKNEIDSNETDLNQFDNEVNLAGLIRFMQIKIDPSSNRMITIFRLNTTQKYLEIFFASDSLE